MQSFPFQIGAQVNTAGQACQLRGKGTLSRAGQAMGDDQSRSIGQGVVFREVKIAPE